MHVQDQHQSQLEYVKSVPTLVAHQVSPFLYPAVVHLLYTCPSYLNGNLHLSQSAVTVPGHVSHVFGHLSLTSPSSQEVASGTNPHKTSVSSHTISAPVVK